MRCVSIIPYTKKQAEEMEITFKSTFGSLEIDAKKISKDNKAHPPTCANQYVILALNIIQK